MPIPFLFRSIIGNQLRKMCCISHNTQCPACMFNASCIYGSTFESIVPKDNTALAGRDRIPHPIIIDSDLFIGNELDSFALNIIFLGPAIPHFPYFFYALKKSGEEGVLKERIPFHVADIIEENRSLYIDDERINTKITPNLWECTSGADVGGIEKILCITLISPLRFKVRGQYARKLTAPDFACCLQRRMQVLCSQYGYADDAKAYRFSEGWTIKDHTVKWKDFVHYSARQKKPIQLGGLTGGFVIAGRLSGYEEGLLRFAEYFHSGKNTNFGLGKLTVQRFT